MGILSEGIDRRTFISVAMAGTASLLMPDMAFALPEDSENPEDGILVYEGVLIFDDDIDDDARASVTGNAGTVSLVWNRGSKSFTWRVTLFASMPNMIMGGTLTLIAFEDDGSSTLKAQKAINGSLGKQWSGTWSPQTTARISYNGQISARAYDPITGKFASTVGYVIEPVYYSS